MTASKSRRTGRARAAALFSVAAIAIAVLVPGTQGSFTGQVRSTQNNAATQNFFACRDAARVVPSEKAALSYRLDEPTGSTNAVDYSGNNVSGAYNGKMTSTKQEPQACPADGGGAYTLDGTTSYLSSTKQVPGPQVFTIEIWFKTTVNGGRLIGFGNSATGLSSYVDRHLYLTPNGEVAFGVFDGANRIVATSPTRYADGVWHHAVATLSSTAGMTLYVDGQTVASKWLTKKATDYNGYWRIGYDSLLSWPSAASERFAGQLRYANVYNLALSPGDVLDRYLAGAPTPPAAIPSVNLAQEEPSTSSSNYMDRNPATKANDGNTDGNYNNSSVTHTNFEANAWWQVDLTQVRSIGAINVYNRTDCCSDRLSNYWIITANTPFDTSKPPSAHVSEAGTTWYTHQTVSAGSPTRITLPPGVTGRYVLLQQDPAVGATPINLAELQVMSPRRP